MQVSKLIDLETLLVIIMIDNNFNIILFAKKTFKKINLRFPGSFSRNALVK